MQSFAPCSDNIYSAIDDTIVVINCCCTSYATVPEVEAHFPLHGSNSTSHKRLEIFCSSPPKLLWNSWGCLTRIEAKRECAHASKFIDLT